MAFEEAPVVETKIASANVSALSFTSTDGLSMTYSSGGIPQFTCVVEDTSSAKIGDVTVPSAAGVKCLGIAQDAPAVGPGLPVRVVVRGVCKAIAAGAVNYGDTVYCANTSGQLGTAPTTVANPAAAPGVATATTGGSVAAGTYTVAFTWVTAEGETQASPTVNQVTTGATSTITVTPTSPPPAGAIGFNVYISAAGVSSPQYKQTATPIFGAATYVQTAAVSTSTAQTPGANTTAFPAQYIVGIAREPAVAQGDTFSVYVDPSHGRVM